MNGLLLHYILTITTDYLIHCILCARRFMGETNQLDDKRPLEGEKKKGVSREGRGSVSSVASCILRAGVDRKKSATLQDYREDKAAGLSFLTVHMKKSQNVKIQGNKMRY